MIHTFSPNWYKPQCLLFHQNYLFYASNYTLYRYNLESRKVEADKCFRKIAIKMNMNSKDIKIHSIKVLSQKQKWLIIGTNQQHAIILSMIDLQVIGVLRNIGVQSVYICQTGFSEQDNANYAIFADETHGLSKLLIRSVTDYKSTTYQNQRLAKQKVKQIISLSNFNMVVLGKGQILLFDKDFNKIIQQIQPSTIGLDQQYILSLDVWIQSKGEVIQASMLTRTKNNSIFLHYWSISIGSMQQTKSVIFKSILKSQVRIVYPKSLSQKVKNTQKAAMTIKFINPTHILLSSKLGQLLILNLPKCPQLITIKPHSIDDIPAYLELLQDSKHYKQIYSMYTHTSQFSPKPKLYTISTDQTLGIWDINQSTIQFNYNIKFITAQLTSIFYSEADSKMVFFLLKDSNIRSLIPFSTQNYYLNQYWKFTKKFKISKVAMHLQESGIAAMVTECNKVILYDLFDDRLMKIHDFSNKVANDEIINISFQYKSILPAIQKLTTAYDSTIEYTWQPEQLKVLRYYSKSIKNNTQIGLLIQQKSKFVYISELQQKQGKQSHQQIVSIKRLCRIQRVHHTKLWDKNILLFSQYKANNLKLWIYCKQQIIKLQTGIKLGGRCIFKIQYPFVRVVQYKGKKSCIYTYSIQQNMKKMGQLDIELPVFSEQVVLDYHSCQAIFYNGKDDTLAHVQFNTNQAKVSCLEIGNKIQSLSFYYGDHIVSGFKDQSIKVLKLSQITNVKDQPHKKVKKTLQNVMKQQNQNSQKMEQENNNKNSNNKGKSKMMSLQQ